MNRYTVLSLIAAILLLMSSCDNNVKIFIEGEETTVVYGYIDCEADTNYIKITKSFVGDATELAPQYSASNYDYKLNVKLAGKFAKSPNHVTEVILDTTSVFKPYDPEGLFYSGRDQVLYYTTEKFLENEKYQLVIEKKDGTTVSSEIETISGSTLKRPNLNINFESNYTNQIQWATNVPLDLAAYYEVVGYFHYKEISHEGSTDTIRHTMRWFMGSGTGEDLYNSADKRLFVNYTPSTFYTHLAATDNIANNPSDYVQRFAEGFEIVITATGDELYNYILIQNSGSAIIDTPEYTNIENGIGIFSSRSVCSKTLPLNEQTINTLVKDWGFVRIYN